MELTFLGRDSAEAVRDGGIDAMDALNSILEDVDGKLSPENAKILRKAIALSMDAIITHLVNPAIRAHPDLEQDEDTWGDIALARARRRVRLAPRPHERKTEDSCHDEYRTQREVGTSHEGRIH